MRHQEQIAVKPPPELPPELSGDPIDGLMLWLKEAEKAGMYEPTAMTLATVGQDHRPAARIVLFKGLSQTELGERAPRFFTNYESRKSNDMTSNPHVSLVFHWGPMQRQIRIEGVVERVSRGESEIYFDSRERGSQIGAWASPQSHSIQSREELEQIVKDVEARFKDQKVVCPPHWGGWRVVPERIEFWQGVKNRLHDRFVFTKSAEGWNVTRLAP